MLVRNIYSFGHLTFQEYFTARYLAELDVVDMLKILVDRFLYEDKWKEVFLLVASMLPKADKLLVQMMGKNRALLRDEQLNKLLIDNQSLLLEKASKYPSVMRESYGLYYLISLSLALSLARARAQAQALSLALSLAQTQAQARALSLALSLDLDLARDRDRALARALARDLDLDLDLARDLDLDLARDRKSWDQASKFLSANQLIVECLNTDCYVSNEKRQEILDKLFAPLTEEEKRDMEAED